MNLVLGMAIAHNERMPQQMRRAPPATRLPLQTTGDEFPKLSGSGQRGLGRLRHTNGVHQAGPVALPAHREGEFPHIELEDAHTEAPYIPREPIVLSVVQISVDPLRAHVCNGPDR